MRTEYANNLYNTYIVNDMWRSCPIKGVDSGAFGKWLELRLALDTSVKMGIAKPGCADVYVRMNGYSRCAKCEVKSNGGEIGNLFTIAASGRQAFIVYCLNVCNSNTSYELRYVEPRIYTVAEFMQAAIEIGAIRNPSKGNVAKFYHTKAGWQEWLETHGIEFDPDTRYDPEEIRLATVCGQ